MAFVLSLISEELNTFFAVGAFDLKNILRFPILWVLSRAFTHNNPHFFNSIISWAIFCSLGLLRQIYILLCDL